MGCAQLTWITASRSWFKELHTAPLVSVWCWYRVGLGRRAAGPDGRVALGRAHEFQRDHEHPPRRDEGYRRALRRHLERLHLDRSDHLSRDGRKGRARHAALHRGRAHGARPLRARGMRVGADGHHLRAAGRRERSGSAARHRSDRHRVPRARVSASDDRLDRRSSIDDARRSVRRTTAAHYVPAERDARRRRRRGHRRCPAAGGEALRRDPRRRLPPRPRPRSRSRSASGACCSSARGRPRI